VVVATDGFRLSEKVLALDDTSAGKEDFSLLVPAKTLGEIARMFASSEDVVKLTFSDSENLAVFACGSSVVSIRILDGEFPDYKRIIPASHTLTAHAKTAELLQAIKIANVFAKDSKEGNNLLRLILDPSGDCLVYSTTAQSGEGSVNLTMEVDGLESQTLNFNSKYLLDFFNSVKCEEIDVYTGGESSPCLFKSPDIDNFLHLVMPVKLNN
jgi:DNA polymerase-3 subunit beta